MTEYDRAVKDKEEAEKRLNKAIDKLFFDSFGNRLAKDGLPFDEDNLSRVLKPDEVEVIQFLRPNGRRRRMAAPIGEEYVKKAENLILSAEDIGTGQIALWARRIGEDEDKDRLRLADNGPGENSPDNVLRRLIDEVSNVKGEIDSASV